ncbi:MAG TPA: hypothetical protein PK467_18730, partial [Candidatus Wallbacteria bacterium]|nr:hypothetical protein [Candidatus Wallbacteria bacterium]
SSDNISITNAGVDVMVNGKRTSTATSGQQFSLKIGGDGDASGTGVNSGLPVFSTGIVSGNKFTIDAVNTSILGALNVVVSNTEPAAAQFVAAGQRLLVGKIDLQTKKYITNNFADSVRIKSVTLTKPVAGTDVADADITKWELTDGSSTFTGSYTAAGKIKFDNMNYVVPPPSVDADSFTTQKTLSVYATVKDSVRNKTLSFSVGVVGDIPSDGALYGNAATVTLGNNAANAQTLDAGKLVMTDDTTTNGVAPNNKGSASIGDVNVAVLGLNIINDDGSGGAATSPEDVYITQLKITNAGTGVLGTDIDSLKLYEKDVTETFIANASLMTDTATSQKYFQFSDSQLYKVIKNAAAKNLVIKANIPATASNGKTINLKMLSTDVTGKGF